MTSPQQRDLLTKRWYKVKRQKEVTDLHIPLVTALRLLVKPTVLWWHVPNGEPRDPRTAAKLKAMGILPGVADLEFHWTEINEFVGRETGLVVKQRRVLHLELKVESRKPTSAQEAFCLAMRCLGDLYYVAHSVDEALRILGKHELLRPGVEVAGRR
jgi:hypothetical protein